MTSVQSATKGFHLQDFSIRGFRGIENLLISRLGHVNLFVGENGVGKTSILDAVNVYATRCSLSVLADILHRTDEFVSYEDEDGDINFMPDWLATIHGRTMRIGDSIEIGPSEEEKRIKITFAFENYQEIAPLITITCDGKSRKLRLSQLRLRGSDHPLVSDAPGFPDDIPCNTLGPGLPTNSKIALYWDRIALTADETRAIEALNLLIGQQLERIVMVGDPRSRGTSRRAVVRLKNEERPVPLRSLGDGAFRMFSVALALANSRDGFLLIDEVENGIHYSAQAAFWKMVITTAYRNNVQVFATTHSWDCFVGFAKAASELEGSDVSMTRIERVGDHVMQMMYPIEDIVTAANSGIEVR